MLLDLAIQICWVQGLRPFGSCAISWHASHHLCWLSWELKNMASTLMLWHLHYDHFEGGSIYKRDESRQHTKTVTLPCRPSKENASWSILSLQCNLQRCCSWFTRETLDNIQHMWSSAMLLIFTAHKVLKMHQDYGSNFWRAPYILAPWTYTWLWPFWSALVRYAKQLSK